VRRTIPAVVIITCLLITSLASAAGPSGDVILAAVKRNYSAVNDYRADVSLTVKGPQVSINSMKMVVYFKKPNKIHADAVNGMAMVPNGTFFGNPFEQMTNCHATYVRTEMKQGRQCSVLKLNGSNMMSPSQGLTVWVDKERLVPVAMQSAGEAALKTVWRHEKIDGKYYLPVEIIADMQAPEGPNSGKQIKATLKFSNYRVNKGISDKVFEQKPRK